MQLPHSGFACQKPPLLVPPRATVAICALWLHGQLPCARVDPALADGAPSSSPFLHGIVGATVSDRPTDPWYAPRTTAPASRANCASRIHRLPKPPEPIEHPMARGRHMRTQGTHTKDTCISTSGAART